jgi:hypothetical protein
MSDDAKTSKKKAGLGAAGVLAAIVSVTWFALRRRKSRS